MRIYFYLLSTVVAMLVLSGTSGTVAQIPANDSFAGAVVVTGLPFTHSQNTALAPPDPKDPILACADSGGGKTVWFTFTPVTTEYVKFSTANSTPATYHIALGLYTESCGAMVEVDCADDINPGTVRQAIIGYAVQAGVTYYLHVAEWNGGGPSGGVPTGGNLVLDVYQSAPDPLYAGPKSGSIAVGASIIPSALGGQNIPSPVVEEHAGLAHNPPQVMFPVPADAHPASGVYFYRLMAGEIDAVRKMLLIG